MPQRIYQKAFSKEMPLSEIKVPKSFEETKPSPVKVFYASEFYERNGYFDKTIILDNNGYIIHGYIRYLVAKCHELESVPVVQVVAYTKSSKRKPISVTVRLTLWERLSGKVTVTV